MPVVLCPDTRKLSPEMARMYWWELYQSTSPTNAQGRAQGYGPVCWVVNGLSHGLAALWVDAMKLCGGESGKVFKTPTEAARFVGEIAQKLPRSTPVLHGTAAMNERSRVWRVG